jgi:hypothetical protein
LEIIRGLNVSIYKRLDDISCVDINHDHSLESNPSTNGEITSHKLYNFFNLVVKLLNVSLETLLLLDGLLDTLSPVDLIDSQNDLTGPVTDPLGTFGDVVIFERVTAKFS